MYGVPMIGHSAIAPVPGSDRVCEQPLEHVFQTAKGCFGQPYSGFDQVHGDFTPRPPGDLITRADSIRPGPLHRQLVGNDLGRELNGRTEQEVEHLTDRHPIQMQMRPEGSTKTVIQFPRPAAPATATKSGTRFSSCNSARSVTASAVAALLAWLGAPWHRAVSMAQAMATAARAAAAPIATSTEVGGSTDVKRGWRQTLRVR